MEQPQAASRGTCLYEAQPSKPTKKICSQLVSAAAVCRSHFSTGARNTWHSIRVAVRCGGSPLGRPRGVGIGRVRRRGAGRGRRLAATSSGSGRRARRRGRLCAVERTRRRRTRRWRWRRARGRRRLATSSARRWRRAGRWRRCATEAAAERRRRRAALPWWGRARSAHWAILRQAQRAADVERTDVSIAC